MGPFALLQLVGLPVALHVLGSLHEDLGDRYPLSPGLERLAREGRRVVPEPDGRGGPGAAEHAVDPAIQEVFGDAGARRARSTRPASWTPCWPASPRRSGSCSTRASSASADQIDLAMVLGAGWPFHLGGITPYLDRSGYSERVLGRRLRPGRRGRALSVTTGVTTGVATGVATGAGRAPDGAEVAARPGRRPRLTWDRLRRRAPRFHERLAQIEVRPEGLGSRSSARAARRAGA